MADPLPEHFVYFRTPDFLPPTLVPRFHDCRFHSKVPRFLIIHVTWGVSKLHNVANKLEVLYHARELRGQTVFTAVEDCGVLQKNSVVELI